MDNGGGGSGSGGGSGAGKAVASGVASLLRETGQLVAS